MNTMDNKEIRELLFKYNEGKCTDKEKALIETWYNRQRTDDAVDLSGEEIEEDLRNVFSTLPKHPERRTIPLVFRIAAAAVILITLSVAVYFYYPSNSVAPANLIVETLPVETDIAPGGNRATLTLADGSIILLDDALKGKIAEQEGMKVTKTEDGLLTYTFIPSERGSVAEIQYNTISTPKGGQYQIVLADGTKVWLNASSSLTFPTTFAGNERSVKLSGEGYFEVNPERGLGIKNIPFIVKTADQEVMVLGTHFNINSYADEASTVTTLMEGSIQVSQLSTSHSKLLIPGQQSTVILNKGINISTVNPSSAMAWKNGLFQFQGSDIQNVMRQFSRWYDVEVEFEGKVPDIKLWGEVYRNVNASQALEILAYFNLKYKIVQTEKGKKVIIS